MVIQSIWCWTASGYSVKPTAKPSRGKPIGRPSLCLSGQGEPPLQIEACRTAGGWARGVSAQIVQEMALADGLFPAVERAG